jgi:gliding motility-associated-like protein
MKSCAKLIYLLLLTFLAAVSFTDSFADDYFWIGGTGNWSDINHWAQSSGGTVLHNTPPTAEDDVFFDAGSFSAEGQIVSVNAENAVCRNLIWTGALYNPAFINSNSDNLRIFGSISLIEDMDFEYDGTITFESPESGNTIFQAGHSFLNNIYFEGIGGGWQLTDTLKVESNIYFNHGTLNTNDKPVFCSNFYSSNPNERTIILGSSRIFVSSSWILNGSGLDFQSGTSIINAGSAVTNLQGNILTYNVVNLTNISANVQNNSVYVYYDTIFFTTSGNVNGDCYINYLEFSGTGTVNDSDTIKYVIFKQLGANKINGSHFIDTARFIFNGTITGQNRIDYCHLGDKTTVINNNTINYLYAGDTAKIYGTNQIGHSFYRKAVYFRDNNSIEYAYLNCDGDFGGENSFDTLIFTPGFQYIFEFDKTQTINDSLAIKGSCEKPVWIKSSYNGKRATIKKLNGTVSGEHLSLRDIEATGTTPFTALQTVNLGNNVNWNIDELSPRDLYWVNGQGKWTESGHWDTAPGGPGGACPPTELDNVYFAGAGQIIEVDIRNAVCHNMDWTGANNPVFTGDDTLNLVIYGSLKFIENMSFDFEGETHFEDTVGGQTVESAKNQFHNNVRFQGSYGGWTLIDKISTFDTIYHDRGSLSTNGESINCGYFFVRDTCYKELYLHSDTIVAGGSSETISVDGSNLELHADSSVLVTTNDDAIIINKNAIRQIYHNVHQAGMNAQLKNEAYCVFNIVEHYGDFSSINLNCTIDTATFYGNYGTVYDSDTIKTAIFYGINGLLTGNHVVEIAYYYEDGKAKGSNEIDTALFYTRGFIEGSNKIDTTIIIEDALIQGQNIIRTATLLDKGSFYGNNIFDDLTLTYAKKYIFEHDSTQVINENFNANGRCTGNIILMSDFDGKRAVIQKTNGTVEIKYANIRDIEAAGNLPFIANNSIDLGNNGDGWEINTAVSIALYWVDGTGVWSDSLHWAPVSGGQGGYCIPSPVDDVYFDDSSFYQTQLGKEVTLDIENATCRNMSWVGSDIFNPAFHGPVEDEMYIYGSLIFNDSLNLNYDGVTYFESREEGRTIDMKGNSFNNDAVFRGRGGEWSLTNDFSTEGNLKFVHGKLNTNGYDIYCNNFLSTDTNQRELILDTSKVTALTAWNINTQNLDIDADSSFIFAGNNIITFNSDLTIQSKYKDTLVYNDVKLINVADLTNDSVYCYFDEVHFNTAGAIYGDCTIDTAVFEGSGTINDNDTVNYIHFLMAGTINGGHHVINSALFEGAGTVVGNNIINSAIFNSNGSINGNNIIDTTIIFGDGGINGENVFNSDVIIYGDGNIFGTNKIQNYLEIHGFASIYQNNNIHEALLLNWGNFGGFNDFDILTLTPGKTYTLTDGTTQTINQHLNVRGNNCFPITLRSSTQTVQGNISMPETADTVSGDFIIMRDINATGGAVFYAGGHSNNISNNTGWIWDDAPDYIYGLGFDTAYLCSGDSLTITTENFNPNETTIFQWNDGSIGPTYTVYGPGIYTVLAIYSDDCAVPDQVYVEQLPSPVLDLGQDTTICEGQQFEINTSGNYDEYLWNDGTTGESVTAKNTGIYWLQVTAGNGCKTRDSVFLNVLPSPHPYLGEDVIIHNDEFVTLDAGYSGGDYYWSTGDTTQTIIAKGVEGGQEYWVEVYYQGCPGYDTIVIDEYPYCTADVPTAFSPNNDNVNDILFVRGSGIMTLDFRVFNRYGELVFETDDMEKGWDGTTNGEKQNEEVYIYYLKAVCFDGLITEKKGNITLLR